MHNSNTTTKWQGKSKGTVLGYRIFVFLMRHLGIYAAYSLLIFVAFYYFLTEWQSNRFMFYYFRHRLGYSLAKTIGSLYLSYFTFGQIIIDKIAILAGLEHKFTFDFDGQELLFKLLKEQQGGVLISAHIGNFEIAEPFFRKIDLKLQISTITTDMERSVIKEYLEGITERKSLNQYIYVKPDMSHIFEINDVIAHKNIVCFTGDRYFEGGRSLKGRLLGAEATFPAGPFVIASRLKVPVVFVYVMKEKGLHYHLYARIAEVKKADAESLLEAYTDSMEQMLRKYPLQWFNYFNFWEQ
ncbi:lipid A biosynthesis (KDO)2-(lauroyl)-lipid IVA acyltransferase [Capnocytophaga sp. oral taxon 332 str. F0381]|uniref:LpxL/LpxP family acyltransferase n=1 Tax=Capnocytophaga sp. oral taxon 332 TaxID=712213 RepID=UPI0002A23EDD|nr:lipid A biosynthesis (KDO)2-(lauroyl)-lipid IVA acyltransferase [Capnocytophaga sp. oral taxon 332]EKY10709.1 lipid A biosynthesis (KDO)2-(lauroyl)-lipid IVA acyltransferase [Capnocytophaga sp. oral taxon 332 str. F0381]